MGTSQATPAAGGAFLLERVLAQALHSELDLVVLVLGFKADEIRRRIRPAKRQSKLKIVENTTTR